MNASKDCLFCKIVAGEIPSDTVYEDDEVLAFRDINPAAPTHVLVIPKRHIPALSDAQPSDAPILGTLLQRVATIAEKLGLVEGGYRVVNNCGAGAGQTVFHIHLHLLAGRRLEWPPG